MHQKVGTPAKKKLKGGFKNTKTHSDKLTTYREGKFPSVNATAKSPFPENKADVDLKKLVSNEKVWPKGTTPETNKKRYAWGKSGSGRKS